MGSTFENEGSLDCYVLDAKSYDATAMLEFQKHGLIDRRDHGDVRNAFNEIIGLRKVDLKAAFAERVLSGGINSVIGDGLILSQCSRELTGLRTSSTLKGECLE